MYNQTQISPENTYIYALNMVNKNEGTVGELQDETGNELCYEIPEGYNLMGTIETPKKKTFLLLQGNSFKIIEIKDCKAVEKLDIACFTYQNPIKGEYRIINENQELLYFYDGVEPDRYFNLSHPEYHLNCDSFLLKPNYNTAQIRMIDLAETGGDLPTGAYTIKARYVDKIGNVTDWFSETLPYPISALGSFNNPTTVEGNDVNIPTTKSLIYKFWNIDTDYPYVEIAVNKYTDEYTVQSFSYGKFKTETELIISITSINNLSLIDYKSTTIPTAKYENSKTMIQNDNRLIRANLTSKKYDWGKFQIKANDIQVTYTIRQLIDKNTPFYTDVYDSSKSMNFKAGNKSGQYYTNKSLMRDEVYAPGIVWIMKDGSESPVFHISGRKKDLCADGTPAPSSEPNLHNRMPQIDAWDSSTYNTADYSDADVFANSVGRSTFERWQVVNTGFDNSNTLEGSYYECRDLNDEPIRYPDTRDCDGNLIYPNTEGVMDAIRHCKTPDTTLLPHYGFDGSNYYINSLHFLFDNIAAPEEYIDDVVAYKLVIGDRANDKTIVDKGILGTILQQTYQQNLTDSITNSNKDIRNHYIQSMQFSHDNQYPKSYSLQTSMQFKGVSAGGDQAFICLPACSDSIAYQNENNEELDLPVQTAINMIGYHSPLSKLKGSEINGTHIKWERELYTSLTSSGANYPTLSNEHFFVLNNRKRFKNRQTTNLLTTNCYYRFEKNYIPFGLLTNRVIKNSVFINADSTFNGESQIKTNVVTPPNASFNNKTQQEVNVFQVEGSMDIGEYLTSYRRKDSECTSSIFNSGVVPIGSGTDTDVNQWAVPATYTAAFNFQKQEKISNIFDAGGWMSHNYVSIKRYKTDCYRDLTKIKYIDYSNTVWQYDEEIQSHYAIVTSGDIFICRFAFRQSFYGYVPHADVATDPSFLNLFTKDNNVTGDTKDLLYQSSNNVNLETNSIFESKIIDTYYESEINMEWREHNDDIWNNTYFKDDDAAKKNESYDAANAVVKTNLFFPKYYGDKGKELLMLELNGNSISRLTNDGEWKYYQLFKNFYKLNPVYNVISPNYRLLPLQEYRCDTSLFPNRVIWSEKANNEEQKDTYRRFLANNYKDIEGNTSHITDVFEKNGNLYLHTKESLFHLPRTSEQLQLRDSSLNIGTGEYLSLPQVQLTNTNYNFAGQQGRFNRFTTENGIFFVNQEQGMIYNFGENLQSISDDMQQWFYKNLPSELIAVWVGLHGEDYPYLDNLTSTNGIGLQSTIDYTLGRWILHKRDYKPLKKVEIQDPEFQTNNSLVFDNDTKLWVYYTNGGYTLAPFTNTDLWQNKSWTLSYDMESKSWISYHSYQPNWMYQDGNTFYTSNGNIWRHGSGGQRYFYNTPYDARIEWQVSKQKEIVDGISYIMRCQYYDSEVEQWQDYDSDFTKGFLYNTYQTTYMFETTDNELYLWQDFVKKVNIRERIRTINGFRQLNENVPVIVSDWATLKQDYQGYEPYTVVNTPGNYTQNFSKMNSIRDIYTNARMYFQGQPWFRIRWQMVDTQRTKSIR